MGRYPVHTLAADPRQRELDLRPPDGSYYLRIRASPAFTAGCPNCGTVHMTKADYQACVRDRDAAR